MKDVRDALMVARNSDGKLIRLPLSPHLDRATGIALSVGTLLMTWWLVAAATSPAAFAGAQWFISSWLGLLMLFGWTASLFYHLLSGIRHLVWDTGRGLELPQLNGVTYILFGATIVLTVLVWIIGLVVWI
jgi:succinate dehydrogenase / fumarate reductase cytochrome b subunit